MTEPKCGKDSVHEKMTPGGMSKPECDKEKRDGPSKGWQTVLVFCMVGKRYPQTEVKQDKEDGGPRKQHRVQCLSWGE